MTASDPKQLFRPELSELSPYLPHAGTYAIRLDANEAPPLSNPTARERLARAAAATAWERYPDATQHALREAIARRCGVLPDQILVGVGSDEIIALLLTTLAPPGNDSHRIGVLTLEPTFVMYRLSARARGLKVHEVPLDAGWDLDEAATLKAVEALEPLVIFVASPNNPTGTMVTPERLTRLVEAAPRSLVMIDEAYVDYASRNQLDFLHRYDNVAVLRTLSKVGFAALRVGWMIARADLVAELDKVRLPYNLPSVSQALATIALTELAAEIDATCRLVIEERQRVTAALARMPGIRPTESQANFVWFETERNAGDLFAALGQRGILVRSFHGRGGRLERCLRVTIGTPEQNSAFLSALEDCLSP